MATPAWVIWSKIVHGQTLAGLRKLYENLQHLAGDDGTTGGGGYAAYGKSDVAGFPGGYAEVVFRNPAQLLGYQYKVGKIYGRTWMRRQWNVLMYRTKGATLRFTGDGGEEQTQALDDYVDYDATKPDQELFHYRYLGLDSVPGLAVGRRYWADTEGSTVEGPTIDYLKEISL